ncbi:MULTISPECIES: hypothetical protein [unclassified Marinobacterium]|uniref:hypothetical protein n=1 Tax=unclassified Marinobacterium TaxID=2644139 RepID=UPI001569FAF2|nr:MULTISPECIES: hypothetical protein [unclassified Marinobacterium]NRP53640.1 hypothetical protein [Marinobacterium sp. xm-v-242]NRP77890.1 hypothetical protein [Marinobacterium sp. xm-m-383]
MNTEIAISLFHLVANMRYGLVGERSDESLFTLGYGTCSTKHSVLARLLELSGYQVQRYCVKVNLKCLEQYLPRDLASLGRDVFDYHNFLKININGSWLTLDATFGAYEHSMGMPTNICWDGRNNCKLLFSGAMDAPIQVQDLYAEKERLIASLSEHQRIDWKLFFTSLLQYLESR